MVIHGPALRAPSTVWSRPVRHTTTIVMDSPTSPNIPCLMASPLLKREDPPSCPAITLDPKATPGELWTTVTTLQPALLTPPVRTGTNVSITSSMRFLRPVRLLLANVTPSTTSRPAMMLASCSQTMLVGLVCFWTTFTEMDRKHTMPVTRVCN